MTADPPRDPMSAGVHLDRAAQILAGVEAAGGEADVADAIALAQAHAAIAQAHYTGTIARRTGS